MESITKKYHTNLSEYYSNKPLYLDEKEEKKPNVRKLVEQPWQQTKAEMWNEVTETLCDVFFIEARAESKMLIIQQYDFEVVSELVPDSENKECLNDFYWLFMRQKHIFRTRSDLVFQQFYTELQWGKDRTVNIIENSKIEFLSKGRPFIHQYRKPRVIESNLLMTLEGHAESTKTCAFSPDGKYIISGGGKNNKCGELKLWDSQTGKEIRTIFGNQGIINSCCISPNYKYIVSISYSKILIWDFETGKEIASMQCNGGVFCFFSPDSKGILTCDESNDFIIWDADNGKKNITFYGHTESVLFCSFSPDGKRIVSVSNDKTIKIWNVKTGEILSTLLDKELYINSTCGFSPDGKRIFTTTFGNIKIWDASCYNEIFTIKNYNHLCSFSPNGKYIASIYGFELMVMDSNNGDIIFTLDGHIDSVEDFSFSPDSRKIASSGGYNDKTIKIWSLEKTHETSYFREHNNAISTCVFSPDNNNIATASWDKNLKVWDTKTGNLIATFSGHKNRILSCNFSPDGKRIVSGGEDIKIWDVSLNKENSIIKGDSGNVIACTFSTDGNIIVSGSDSSINWWNADTGDEIGKFNASGFHELFCFFSPDGTKIAFKSQNLDLCNVGSGWKNKQLQSHNGYIFCCAFSPDGKRIASGSYDKTIKIWNTDTCTLIATFIGHNEGVMSCAFSPDGKQLASGSYDKTIKIWDIETGVELNTFTGHNDTINYLTFSTDNKRIISLSSDKSIRIWDVCTGKEMATYFGEASVFGSAISGCGTMFSYGDVMGNFYLLKLEGIKFEVPIVTGVRLYINETKAIISAFVAGSWDNKITTVCPYCGIRFPCIVPKNVKQDDLRLFIECKECKKILKLNPFIVDNKPKTDNENGKNTSEIIPLKKVEIILYEQISFSPVKPNQYNTYLESNYKINSCAFSPNGKWIVSGCNDKILKLHEVETGKEIATLIGHADEVTSCAFSPDNKWIVSGSKDTTLKIWHTETGNLASTFTKHSKAINFCFFSPDGKWVISGSDDETYKIWDVEVNFQIDCRSQYSPVKAGAISQDGAIIVVGVENSQLVIRNFEYGGIRSIHTDNKSAITSCALSPDGSIFVSGSNENTLKVWNSHTRVLISTFNDHNSIVIYCAFSPDGKWIISASFDGVIILWDANTTLALTSFNCDRNISACAISACGTKIIYGDLFGNIFFLRIEGFSIDIPIITRVRLFKLITDNYNQIIDGEWDEDITASCPHCRVRFKCNVPDGKKIDEPRLLTTCPECGGNLKFNSDVMDNREKTTIESSMFKTMKKIIKAQKVKDRNKNEN